MPNRNPKDYPGAWWHVTNRGIAKRSAFESALDVEHFLGFLQLVALAGLIEVHAFSILTTHFHLLVRSLAGELPRAIHRLTLRYVRWFNRSRRRDGSLFRGRYRARLIEDDVYWECVVRYIDRNPVSARMCTTPSEYPFGSARIYAGASRPDWLTTHQIEASVAAFAGRTEFRPMDYDAYSQRVRPEVLAAIVEAGLSPVAHTRTVPLTDLIRSATHRQRRWFEWKAELADGSLPGTVIVPSAHMARVLDRLPSALRDERTLHAALLRDLCGASFIEIAGALGCAVSSAHGLVRRHRERARRDEDYRSAVARTVDIALRSVAVPPPARQVVGVDR